ncbi:MAG: hypothetical protein EA387_01695 [Nitriliruptor sp.]|nr:MAG: hypothetical protein EA387_01695 [Nitriliruptor sp.]
MPMFCGRSSLPDGSVDVRVRPRPYGQDAIDADNDADIEADQGGCAATAVLVHLSRERPG